jgi:hypothetical protein
MLQQVYSAGPSMKTQREIYQAFLAPDLAARIQLRAWRLTQDYHGRFVAEF